MSQRKRSAALLLPTDLRAQGTNRSHACSRSAADHPARKMMCQDELFREWPSPSANSGMPRAWEYFSIPGVLNCES